MIDGMLDSVKFRLIRKPCVPNRENFPTERLLESHPSLMRFWKWNEPRPSPGPVKKADGPGLAGGDETNGNVPPAARDLRRDAYQQYVDESIRSSRGRFERPLALQGRQHRYPLEILLETKAYAISGADLNENAPRYGRSQVPGSLIMSGIRTFGSWEMTVQYCEIDYSRYLRRKRLRRNRLDPDLLHELSNRVRNDVRVAYALSGRIEARQVWELPQIMPVLFWEQRDWIGRLVAEAQEEQRRQKSAKQAPAAQLHLLAFWTFCAHLTRQPPYLDLQGFLEPRIYSALQAGESGCGGNRHSASSDGP